MVEAGIGLFSRGAGTTCTVAGRAEPDLIQEYAASSAEQTSWVREASARVRDEGHVFHAEVFVVPRRGAGPTAEEVVRLRDRIDELDWNVHDIVIAPVDQLPASDADLPVDPADMSAAAPYGGGSPHGTPPRRRDD
ncbi:MAG: hypothetical protein L0G94_08275 [Brachybacterium sp.]|uniref:hypothetical protein n=1 Tax=Brachybacterium sp. TaxID=1891286 RepID=UPI002648EE6F|nr:hypothetical protein [Brachybacterium sp.]MDN5686661.1 hypothetical protein [Brachybacterium sp.]